MSEILKHYKSSKYPNRHLTVGIRNHNCGQGALQPFARGKAACYCRKYDRTYGFSVGGRCSYVSRLADKFRVLAEHFDSGCIVVPVPLSMQQVFSPMDIVLPRKALLCDGYRDASRAFPKDLAQYREFLAPHPRTQIIATRVTSALDGREPRKIL